MMTVMTMVASTEVTASAAGIKQAAGTKQGGQAVAYSFVRETERAQEMFLIF